MRPLIGVAATLALLLVEAKPSDAGALYTHSGSTDPTTEGFTGVEVVGPASTTGPLTNDQGLPAWFIAGSGLSSQYGYYSPALTASQKADIASQGFTMTVVARVEDGLAPPYTTSAPVRTGVADVEYGGVRWELDLALNSNGDTVAILPNTIAASGPGGSVETFGASYTLTGSGSTYHTLQLFYNPTTHTADLSVDGVIRLTGYTGETSFGGTEALAFAATSGGQGNFNFVQLQIGSVPEPTSLMLLVTGMGVVIGYGRSRRRRGA